MDNPFESGHIKNYIMAYVSVVVIMILFFIASTLFYDVKEVKTKEFKVAPKQSLYIKKEDIKKDKTFKLLKKGY